MESSAKVTEESGTRKPVKKSVQTRVADQPGPVAFNQPLAAPSIEALPAGPGTSALRQKAVLQMQRTHGNAMVMRQIQPDVQRVDGETEPAAVPATEPAAAAGGTPSEISGSGGSITTEGGINITGGNVTINGGMTRVSGVLQTDTLIATTVAGTTYTPGVGNVM